MRIPVFLIYANYWNLNITDNQADYARKITENLKKHSIRVISDLRNEKIGFKIRAHTLYKVPYLVIIGERELDSKSLSVRTQAGEDLGSMELKEFLKRLYSEINHRC